MNYLKPVLLFFGLFLSVVLMAQSPQSFSYQAVATDVNGDELTEQDIALKAVILRGSITGTVEWEELHYVTTDLFGLFTINIGEGNPNGGAVSQFADINWSNGPFFLRIEMDVTGGSSFVTVGTNQLLSVPFSLYADQSEKAITATFADSAAVSQTAIQATYADSAGVSQSALTAHYADSSGVTGIASHALTADTAQFAQNAAFAQNAFAATNATNAINAQSAAFAQAAYIAINDQDPDPTNEIQSLTFSGDTLSISEGNFITLSSSSIFNLPGATLNFPQGYPGGENFIFIPDQYTVPADKVFYMVAGEDLIRLPGVGSGFGNHITRPHLPMLPPNSMIDNCHCIGFLADETYAISPVVLVLLPNGGSTYTIPTGSYLVIKSGLDGNNFLALNNIAIDFFSTEIEAIVIPGGIQIKNTGSEEMILTGYLGG
ncbi:MAG: hypothetical protein KDC85_23405 [Saprospiraceae bacterium]|nr:hypothetical protein [Saprospiraceae bacterium]MCB9326322.1 hypothetical protein [Lewinellaceae bacterium]